MRVAHQHGNASADLVLIRGPSKVRGWLEHPRMRSRPAAGRQLPAGEPAAYRFPKVCFACSSAAT